MADRANRILRTLPVGVAVAVAVALASCSGAGPSPTAASLPSGAAGTSAGVDQASAPWSVSGVTVPSGGVLGTTPADVILPDASAITPPGPPAPGAPASDVPPLVLSGTTRLGLGRDGDASDPDVAAHVYTLITVDPIMFDGADYLVGHTSSADRDRALVDRWGMISGSLRAWHAVSSTSGAQLMGLLVLEFPSAEAAQGALAHFAERGRGAADHIERFAVDGVPSATGLSYVEYPRSDGAPLPGEMVVLARGRFVAAVMTSGPRPQQARADLVDFARLAEADLSART